MRERAKKRSESIKKRKAQKAAEELAMETTTTVGETAAPTVAMILVKAVAVIVHATII